MARACKSSELDPTGAGTPSRGPYCTGRAQTRRCTAFAYGYIAAVAIARRSRPTATTREASAEPSESACTDRTPDPSEPLGQLTRVFGMAYARSGVAEGTRKRRRSVVRAPGINYTLDERPGSARSRSV